MNNCKIMQLTAMLTAEEKQPQGEQYGAHLSHWAGTSKPINIDAGAIRVLIEYYNTQEVAPCMK